MKRFSILSLKRKNLSKCVNRHTLCLTHVASREMSHFKVWSEIYCAEVNCSNMLEYFDMCFEGGYSVSSVSERLLESYKSVCESVEFLRKRNIIIQKYDELPARVGKWLQRHSDYNNLEPPVIVNYDDEDF